MPETTEEFLKRFRELPRRRQDDLTYRIAERYLAKITKPENIQGTADAIRLALVGEPLPSPCHPRWPKGYAIGRAICDGQLQP